VYIFGISLLLFMALFNLNQIFTNGYLMVMNETITVGCYGASENDSSWFYTWGRVHLFTYSLVPFSILLIFNILLIFEVRKSRLSISANNNSFALKRKFQMSLTVIILTFSFIIMTLPGAIVSGFFFAIFTFTDEGYFKLILFDSITFSYHAFNFFILLLSNKKFSEAFKSMVCNLFSKAKLSIETTNRLQKTTTRNGTSVY
jgi:hypothetical protein